MTFYGKNKQKSSMILAGQRAFYKTNAFPERGGTGPEQVSDFTFAEFVNYGRIDTRMETVTLNTENLSFLNASNANASIPLLNFVAEAANDLIGDFERAVLIDKIPVDNELLSAIAPVMGYTDPKEAYYKYVNAQLYT